MIETREKNIDGSTYSVTQLPARRALRLKTKLIKLFGAVLAQMYLKPSEKTSEEQTKQDFVRAMEILSSNIDEGTFENLIMEILIGVRKNGMELNEKTIDLEFAGDMVGIYKVVWFVLEVNFANFFSALGIGQESILPEMQDQKSTKKTFMRD